MVSPSTSKKENAAEFAQSVLNTSSNRLAAGAKPLQKLRFYLDLKNIQTAGKIESKIKELGGHLEVFLVKEVTHVVTDCEAWYYNRSSVSNKTSTNAAPNKKPNAKVLPKTRADAMLERVRCKETVIAKNPLEQAKQWGITIWTVEKAIAWLDKVSIVVISQTKKKTKVYDFKAPYIKFESFDRQTRPVFRELSSWPAFNFAGAVGDPAFTYRSRVERNMTRKTRSHHPRINPGSQPGYCEVCRIEYAKLSEHLSSDKHQSYVKDDSNFIGLDSLINEKANIESFLKLHGDTISEKCGVFEGDCFPEVILNKMPRNSSGRNKNLTMSPVKNEIIGHRLRSKSHINYYANSNDDDFPTKPEGAREVRELRSSARLKNHQIENGQECWESGRPKRSTCTLKKKYSSDERLVADNKNYYKVEVLPNKLRSSTLSTREQDLVKRLSAPISEEDSKGFIVKFRKIGASELLRLNNEAENFLFPKRDEVSSDEDPDADGPNTTVSSGNHNSTLLLSSEPEKLKKLKIEKVEDEASMDSNYSESSVSRKKRRRTHAEAFINDNEKYYKFETPGSRLRYQGSFLPPIANNVPKNNGDYITKTVDSIKIEGKTKNQDRSNEDRPKINLDELQFSFERVPKSEPWYQTFQRQDRGEEYYTCFSDSGYFKPFLLPYEMGNLPPLNPKVCISAYSDAKKVFTEPPSASTSAGCSTPDPCSNSGQAETDFEGKDEDSRMSAESVEKSADEQTNDDEENSSTKKRKRRSTFIPGKISRKSPRQHASTLAILSSLLQQRKRKEKTTRSSEAKSLPSIPEENKNSIEDLDNETDYDVVSKKIDDFLNVSADDMYELEISSTPGIDLQCKVSAVELLDDLENKETEEDCTNSNSARKPGRKKKKKNRTGWPNKNRRVRKDITIKEEVDDVASIGAYSEEETTDISSINRNDNISHVNNSLEDDVYEKNDTNYGVDNKNQSASDCSDHAGDKSDRVETVCSVSMDSVDEIKRDSVNVDLEKWENAEKILQAKITNNECINNDITFQPFVRVQKLDSGIALKHDRGRVRSGSSPRRSNVKRRKISPSSPKSPKVLRKPRGRWYRER